MRLLLGVLCLVACGQSAAPDYPHPTANVAGVWRGDTTVTLTQFTRCQFCWDEAVPVWSGATEGSIRGDTLTLGGWRLVLHGDTLSGQGPRLVRH